MVMRHTLIVSNRGQFTLGADLCMRFGIKSGEHRYHFYEVSITLGCKMDFTRRSKRSDMLAISGSRTISSRRIHNVF